ncbi:Gfo/Idh/MocA family protein [Algihabitans albus]|uniref:Gfo/Idh/MocA family protein n=1 Tax=Algihabitans albus TaxID=2164067 RepID=UPI000E5CFA67|nr:Gfo/Idh/MocA family oxidoreductase [Algihabitans albus]
MSLRAGVIGLGVGFQHAIGLAQHPNCDLAALCDRDPVKRQQAKEHFPGVPLFETAEALLEESDLDLICVASYDDDHANQILRALTLGRHVFAEKPLCLMPEETAAIRDALERRRHLRLSSNTVLRASPRFAQLKRDIDDGRLGRIYAIEGDYNYGRLEKLTAGWRGRIPNYSVMLGGGIHVADLLLWLTGQAVGEVVALGNGIASTGSEFSGRDYAIALLRFADGTVGKLSANFGCVEPHFHRLLVYGTEATFENGRGSARLWRSRAADAVPEDIATPYPGVAKHALLPSFVEAILHGSAPLVDENDVLGAMELCHAIDQAIDCGRPVKVETSRMTRAVLETHHA